jgi:hypothetical protein
MPENNSYPFTKMLSLYKPITMHKIKTFADACKALKLDPKKLPIVTGIPAKDRKAIIAHYKLVIIARALNAGWKPNWKDGNEPKFYAWFWMDKAGSGFSYDGCGRTYSGSAVGSRLCFKSADLADYAGKQFKSLYKDYFLLSR